MVFNATGGITDRILKQVNFFSYRDIVWTRQGVLTENEKDFRETVMNDSDNH
jgi:hypothetical protein